jgi:Secretion system C-terminal sorting domain
MKNKSIVLCFFLTCFYFTGLSQPIGFLQTECGIIQNPSYWIYNFEVGSHGHGYTLFHNNIALVTKSGNLDQSYAAASLEMIDDTTGFYVELGPSFYPNVSVFKIINNSVFSIGNGIGWGYFFELFVASRHTVYISSFNHYNNSLIIYSLSDLKPPRNLVFTNKLTSDTTIYDTVLGLTFCPDLNTLNYLFNSSNDTLIITIRLKVDTLDIIETQNIFNLILFPNPANDFLWIKSNDESFYSIFIFDKLGRIMKSILDYNPKEKPIYIGDLQPGLYLLNVKNRRINHSYKIVKI